MSATHALLCHCIDYAGLFPPAGLDLETSVENYASYRAGPDAWALGRLVLPADRAPEFAERWPGFAAEWPIALLLRKDIERELRLAEAAGVSIDMAEYKPLSAEEMEQIVPMLPASTPLYVEVGTRSDPAAMIAAIAAAGARAKVRTGGIEADAIPPTAEIARFIACCVAHRVPFKATAGLHHPLRGVHPLTYDPDSEQACMHGFLNVLLSSALLIKGSDTATAISMLEESSLESFRFGDDHICWRDWTFSKAQLLHVRENAMLSFGSCSFLEPLQEMRAGGLLQ